MAIDLFDVDAYRAANTDLGAAGLTTDEQLTQHFQNFGVNEGRFFSFFANLSVYRSSNPDLVAAGLTSNQQLLGHLQNFGVAEGRRFSQYVDIDFYRNLNGDVNQAYGGNRELILEHLSIFGIEEGRWFSPFMGTNDNIADNVSTVAGLDYYLFANSDVYNAVNGSRLGALVHLELYGINESRSFSPFVDVGYYLANNADVSQAFNGNQAAAFAHLVSFGVDEGRSFSPAFNASAYPIANPDLASAGINTNRQRFEHWVTYGLSDRRSATADPGNTLGTALSLGSPSSGFTYFHNFISGSDTNDYYRFTLTTTRFVSVDLFGLSNDLDIALRSSNGSLIQESTFSGNAADSITFNNLSAGTYYVQVFPGVNGASSGYDLFLTFLDFLGSI
ncbi:PPC domain-containing protein [Phormidium sp. FACHB-592]|uniref:PPC domain-containing protein n=1 Tax=Stenomitos frigidus AS-A4 TaxID=2933935 RepID=A0ABV0KNN0_9CYAN|nr:PPC domain-containing protein [Phormidium sp. FACHB-592]MBD2077324.1 PPC domain-containing protein [Phormidium sp. FACHB-592]